MPNLLNMSLQSCPHCGNSAILYKKYQPDGRKVYKVACRHPHHQPPCPETDWHGAKDLAIKQWNDYSASRREPVPGSLEEMKL